MTDTPDSQGHYNDFGPNLPEVGAAMSPDDHAEWQARNDRAIDRMERFYDLAPDYYWRAIEMETLHREVLRDTNGAQAWRVLAEKIRARVNAQIDAELTEQALDEVA